MLMLSDPLTHLSQNLQKYSVDCLGIPSVMSTFVRRQATHMLAELGSIRVPHSQQRLFAGYERRSESLQTIHNTQNLHHTLLCLCLIHWAEELLHLDLLLHNQPCEFNITLGILINRFLYGKRLVRSHSAHSPKDTSV